MEKIKNKIEEKNILEKSVINKTQNKNSSSSKKSDITNNENKLMLVIRISGLVKVNKFIEDTLYKLRLRRKYSAIVIKPTKDISGMIKKVMHYTSFGEIEKETLIKLLKARAQRVDKKQFKAEEVAEELISGKSLKELGFKPFFRLHPPRKGIRSKILARDGGVLGYNKEINQLVERML